MFTPLKEWPEVSRSPRDILSLFGRGSKDVQARLQQLLSKPDQPVLGLDLEYNPDTGAPSILGVSDGALAVSVPWRDGLPFLKELLERFPKAVLVGHAVITADVPLLEAHGITVENGDVEDTIIRFWLTNMHLCKSTKKSSLEDADEQKRGQGYMNLGTMLTTYTNLSNYKECRGRLCHGPCPEHDVFGYNGVDARGPMDALPGLLRHSKLRGVEKLYPLHRKLARVTHKMSEYGLQVDVPYVEKLREEFERDKEEIAKSLPFNPDSPKQVREYFGEKGIELEDTTESTVRAAVEENDNEDLGRLLEYKELGDGPDRWFAPRRKNEDGHWVGFVDKDGRVHPRLGFYTSSARLNCVSPNMQNVAKRRIDRKTGENVGKKIRRAIIAPEGYYIVRADLSNAENRVFLYHAGYEIPRDDPSGKYSKDGVFDLHSWVRDIANITEDMEFAISLGGARDAAKSIQHAGNYMEGLQLKTVEELNRPRIRKEIEVGARIVYPGWKFGGKVVTFTGANLAQRAFGDKSHANRKKALEVAEKYFGRFEKVRELQMKITKAVETEQAVRTPLGYYTLSYGDAEDRMKAAAAIWGSQPVAHITKLALVDLWDKFEAGRPLRPVLQVHDEILCYCPNSVEPKESTQWLVESMEPEIPEMPRLIVPAEPSYGDNWRDQKKVK